MVTQVQSSVELDGDGESAHETQDFKETAIGRWSSISFEMVGLHGIKDDDSVVGAIRCKKVEYS